jgi:hypothetical protein
MWKFAEAGVFVPGDHGVTIGSPDGAIAWDFSSADTTVADPRADIGEFSAIFRVRHTMAGTTVPQEAIAEHRLLLWRRPMICTTSDVKAIFTAWSETFDSRAPVWIAAVTEFFEEYASRKILKLDASAPEREVIPLSTGGARSSGRRTVRLRRYPIDEVLSFGFAAAEGDPTDPDWEALPAGLPADADIDAQTGRLSFPGWQGCHVYVEYTGGMAVATGGLPRDLRQMAALQVGFILQNEHRLGVTSYTSGAQPGASTNFVMRQSFLLPEVQECFDRHRRLS